MLIRSLCAQQVPGRNVSFTTFGTSSGHLGSRSVLDSGLLKCLKGWDPSFHPQPWFQIKWPLGTIMGSEVNVTLVS